MIMTSSQTAKLTKAAKTEEEEAKKKKKYGQFCL